MSYFFIYICFFFGGHTHQDVYDFCYDTFSFFYWPKKNKIRHNDHVLWIYLFEKMQKIISLFDNNYASNIEAVKNIRYLLNIFYLYTQIYIIYKKVFPSGQ